MKLVLCYRPTNRNFSFRQQRLEWQISLARCLIDSHNTKSERLRFESVWCTNMFLIAQNFLELSICTTRITQGNNQIAPSIRSDYCFESTLPQFVFINCSSSASMEPTHLCVETRQQCMCLITTLVRDKISYHDIIALTPTGKALHARAIPVSYTHLNSCCLRQTVPYAIRNNRLHYNA